MSAADEIAAGQVRLFGGAILRSLRLSLPGPLAHWTAYESGEQALPFLDGDPPDVKFIWEPARFTWAFTLGRAYLLSGGERYPQAFWQHAETFLEANPPNLGPHWASAQEVALRLLAFVFALQIFDTSPHTTPERRLRLAGAVAAHAARIPPTLVYARAQNNNHLLSEAAGLYTAGLALPQHPQARHWRELGWKWFHRGLQAQITLDGVYSQHSANYHRLMLHLALWVQALAYPAGDSFSPLVQERLASATRWLLALCDPASGGVPNLGPNDGAYILPLTACPFADYRPVLQSAALTFLGQRPFPSGPWDEMALWLDPRPQTTDHRLPTTDYRLPTTQYPALSSAPPDTRALVFDRHPIPLVLHSPDHASWAYLRAAHFTGRPGHADQLHLDLWWRGMNIALDAGTYLYNTPPPWDNALARTAVHNTLTVNGLDQMRRAGRFLYLDRAQAKLESGDQAPDGSWKQVTASHDGYRRLGLQHRRTVTALEDGGWLVEDALLPLPGRPAPAQPFSACLHWLLPDYPWEFDETAGRLRLQSPLGWITLAVRCTSETCVALSDTVSLEFQLVRAGELLYGSGDVSPVWGWVSPTYGVKAPALGLRVGMEGKVPLGLCSVWRVGVRA